MPHYTINRTTSAENVYNVTATNNAATTVTFNVDLSAWNESMRRFSEQVGATGRAFREAAREVEPPLLSELGTGELL